MTPGIDATMLDPFPLWGIGLALIAVFFLAAELGYFTYRHVRRHPGDKSANDEVQVLSTALVLLALLLGFTFSMALSRYDERRGQVVQEANDIGTAWLRAGLYEGDAAQQLQAKLHAYARIRVADSLAGDTDGAYVDLIVEGAELRNQILGADGRGDSTRSCHAAGSGACGRRQRRARHRDPAGSGDCRAHSRPGLGAVDHLFGDFGRALGLCLWCLWFAASHHRAGAVYTVIHDAGVDHGP